MIPVLGVASEIFPLVKTGGLADVVGAMPAAMKEHDIDAAHPRPRLSEGHDGSRTAARRSCATTISSAVPRHSSPARPPASTSSSSTRRTSSTARAIPISAPTGKDWPDNWRRFAALSYAAADIGRGAVPPFTPAVVHPHDWQAALAPVYLRFAGAAAPDRS